MRLRQKQSHAKIAEKDADTQIQQEKEKIDKVFDKYDGKFKKDDVKLLTRVFSKADDIETYLNNVLTAYEKSLCDQGLDNVIQFMDEIKDVLEEMKLVVRNRFLCLTLRAQPGTSLEDHHKLDRRMDEMFQKMQDIVLKNSEELASSIRSMQKLDKIIRDTFDESLEIMNCNRSNPTAQDQYILSRVVSARYGKMT